MKNKKLWIAIVAVLAAAAVLVGIFLATRPQATDGEKEFTLIIVHSDGSVKEKQIRSTEEYLAPALVSLGYLTEEGVETGMYLTVDGETASWEENQSYWAFYVDGDYATEGMNTTPIAEGAVYQLEYTVG